MKSIVNLIVISFYAQYSLEAPLNYVELGEDGSTLTNISKVETDPEDEKLSFRDV